MHTHWSHFVPNNYVNPTSEDIKLLINNNLLSQNSGRSESVSQISGAGVKVEVVFLCFPCLIVSAILSLSVDLKQH